MSPGSGLLTKRMGRAAFSITMPPAHTCCSGIRTAAARIVTQDFPHLRSRLFPVSSKDGKNRQTPSSGPGQPQIMGGFATSGDFPPAAAAGSPRIVL